MQQLYKPQVKKKDVNDTLFGPINQNMNISLSIKIWIVKQTICITYPHLMELSSFFWDLLFAKSL